MQSTGGNDIYGNPYGYTPNVKYVDVFTDNLTAEQINVGQDNTTPLYTLPIVAPPSTPSVMVAQQAGSQVFRIPNVTFKWTIQTTNGNFYNVNVPVSAGDYNLQTDIFPLIENQFQVVLAPLTASGDYICSLVGGKFTLTLANGVFISQTLMLSSSTSDNGYLGSAGNSIIIGNSGSVTVPNNPQYTTLVDPLMHWLPYNNGGGGGDVTNPMSQNLDANDYSIKKLGYINLIKSTTPTNPVDPEVTFYSDSNGNLASVNSSGTVLTLKQNQISALDSSSSLTCNNSGTISSIGAVNLNANTLSGVTQINGDPSATFRINKSNCQLNMDTDTIGVLLNGNARMYVDTVSSTFVAPDTTSGLNIQNGVINAFSKIVLPSSHSASNPELQWTGSTNTGLYSSAPGTVNVTCSGNSVLNMNNSSVSAATQFIVPSAHDVNNPDIRFNDSSNTGFYSSATNNVDIAISGVQAFHLDNLGTASNSRLRLNNGLAQQNAAACIETLPSTSPTPSLVNFVSVGAQSNIVTSRVNGSISVPTKVLNNQNLGNFGCQGWLNTGAYGITSATIGFQASEDFNTTTNRGTRIIFATTQNAVGNLLNRMVLDNNGFLGVGQLTPAATIDISGASGTTLKIVDTNQGAGRILTSDANGVASWTAPSTGWVYYEPAIGASTSFAFGVMSTKYIINPTTTLANNTNYDSPSAGRLRYTGTPTRVSRCNITVSFTNNTGTTPQQIYFWPFKNGSVLTGGSTTNPTGTGTADFRSVTLSFLVSLATNDYIELYASNESGTTGVNVHSLQISCM